MCPEPVEVKLPPASTDAASTVPDVCEELKLIDVMVAKQEVLLQARIRKCETGRLILTRRWPNAENSPLSLLGVDLTTEALMRHRMSKSIETESMTQVEAYGSRPRMQVVEPT
ncbi:unnamed protein product [Phytophthora lilii]|uniref:Unnamed protein product n=1 Tax=Phytophthora lilii TaxID=2077276 RepID=A0A9W6UEN1_9STRA|nr:unnamed protein product [Phytophthora lilii]